MSRILLISFALLSASCVSWTVHEPTLSAARSPSQGKVSVTATLTAGTPVIIAASSSMTTGTNSISAVGFFVMHEVRDGDGQVVLPAGSPAMVRIHELPARRLGRPGEILIEAVGVTAIDETLIPAHGEAEIIGRDKVGMVAGLTAGMFFVYPLLNFLHLLQRGGEAYLPPGFNMTVLIGP